MSGPMSEQIRWIGGSDHTLDKWRSAPFLPKCSTQLGEIYAAVVAKWPRVDEDDGAALVDGCAMALNLADKMFGLPDYSKELEQQLAYTLAASITWKRSGSPRLVLTSSMAAMFAATRAPKIMPALPYPAFTIEIPEPFNGPVKGGVLGVFEYQHEERSRVYIDASDGSFSVVSSLDDGTLDEDMQISVDGVEGDIKRIQSDLRFQRRMLLNTIAYVSQYRENVSKRHGGKRGTIEEVCDVRPPPEVRIDREFRERAAGIVFARTFNGARQALRHMVRGHWKMQAHGTRRSERSMKWVHPYLRGRESMGVVIEKVSRLSPSGGLP